MVSAMIMGATTDTIMSRRRTSSVDKDMINNAITNSKTSTCNNGNNNYNNNYNYKSRIRQHSDTHYQSLKVHFRSNDREDESDHNSECGNDLEEIDTCSFSSQSIDEIASSSSPLPPNSESTLIGNRSCSDTDIEQQQQQKKNIIRNGHRRSFTSTTSSLISHCVINNNNSSNKSSKANDNGNNSSHSACTDITEKTTTRLWRSLIKIRNPLFLLLVTCVSLLGVGLYTQSYATLSLALEQVTVITQERRKKVTVNFDTVEQDIHRLERQLLEIDPGALFISSSSAFATTSGRTINTDDTVSSSSSSFDDEDKDKRRQSKKKVDEENNNNHSLQLSSVEREKLEQTADESGLFDEMVSMQEKLRISNFEMSSLQKYVQMTSLRDATRKYGTGVIRVQLELDFPEDRKKGVITTATTSNKVNANNRNIPSNVTRKTTIVSSGDGSRSDNALVTINKNNNNHNILILEMAETELMPHSVFTFLEMVHAKLFDGCSFILNAMDVVKAAPLPYDGSSASQKVKAFTKLGLDTVSFREYSPEYPHEQYTVGFSADGSPSFYINTHDNSEQHVGEPCFATIVSGFETVERLEAAPTRNGIWYRKRIGLKRAVIL